MKPYSRLRIWIWIVVLPIIIVSFLTLFLREAARNAEGRPQSAEIDQDAAEAYSKSLERAAAARVEREQQQVDEARQCARMVRPMLNRPDEGPLLMVLTGDDCRTGCSQLEFANALMDDYARLGLGGVWVKVRDQPPISERDPAPAMSRMVVSQCSALLGGRTEFWAVFDRRGEPLAMPPYYQLADSSPAERLEAMRVAARDASYAR